MTVKRSSIEMYVNRFRAEISENSNDTTKFLDFLEQIFASEPRNLSDCAILLDLVREVGPRWPGLAEEVGCMISTFLGTGGKGWQAASDHGHDDHASYVG